MNDILVAIFSLIWLPTLLGFGRGWRRWWRVRRYGLRETWLILLVAIIATLATPVVVYISLLSALRWLGATPVEAEWVMIGGTVAAFLIAFIVPTIEIAFELWRHGQVSNPTVPVEERKVPNGA